TVQPWRPPQLRFLAFSYRQDPIATQHHTDAKKVPKGRNKQNKSNSFILSILENTHMVGLYTSPPLSAPPSLHSHTTNSSLSSYSSHPRSTHPSSIASSSTPGFRDFEDGITNEL